MSERDLELQPAAAVEATIWLAAWNVGCASQDGNRAEFFQAWAAISLLQAV